MNEANLHNYQRVGVEHILENTHAGLFLDMGLGKTVTTLTAINRLIYEWLEVDTVLVIAPKRVADHVWQDEAAKWEHLRHLRIVNVAGTAKTRRDLLKVKADVYLISRDLVTWLVSEFGGRLPFDMLVVDELSSFKAHGSKRFKSLRLTRGAFKRIVGLTGTPAPNGLIDLWAQVYLLDGGERLGTHVSKFRQKYFKEGQRNGHVVYNYKPLPGAPKRIEEAIGDICISMSAEDYLDLPDRIEEDYPVRLSPSKLEEYKEFERESVLEILAQNDGEGTEITATSAAALSGKLQQFANGAVYDSDKAYHVVHDAKLDALEDIVESANGEPVLVAIAFIHDRERILERLKKYGAVAFTGGDQVERWNRSEIPVLVMHPASGGHGLNIQLGGRYIVWFGLTWSLELFQQLNARLHRQGQRKNVFIYFLTTEGTIDSDIRKALDRKNGGQRALLDAVKARIEEYAKLHT